MSSSRYYQPAMASFTKGERKFLGLAEDAGLNYFIPEEMTTRKIVTAKGIDDSTRITYNFSYGTRINQFVRASGGKGRYGTDGISFRLLYEFLCSSFNGGEYFIDTYFEKIFNTREVYGRLNTINDDIISDIEDAQDQLFSDLTLKEDGTPDMRYTTSRRYTSLDVWRNPIRMAACTDVAHAIQDDVVQCLASGRIPLRKGEVAESTKRLREQFIGLDSVKFFYASGQLIRHLNVFVSLEEQ
jgi:hypothetical protein